MTIIRTILICTVLASLAACGFQLRGSGPNTLNVSNALNVFSVYVQSQGANRFAEEVKTQLQFLDITTPRQAEEAEYVLHLQNEKQDRKVLTVSSSTGKVQEFELTFSVLMSVSDTNGDVLSTQQTVKATRDLIFDEDAVLGKYEEEKIIYEELRRQVAASVLRRMQAVVH